MPARATTFRKPSPKRELPRIDRIVLYIDDLDRCPEDKVVDVLQAVHLLLAFPLFVVVVGVDSRRLLQSLKHRLGVGKSEQLLDAHDGISDEERLHWQSTPLNYLEKIFQIPFTLRPMDGAGFGKLIDNLVETKSASPTATTTAVSARVTVPGDAPQSGARVSANAPGSRQGVRSTSTKAPATTPNVTGSTSASALNLNPGFLAISSAERDFMKSLHALIPSPRATKRFVNIYRLLRASVPDPVAYLAEQHYRPALLLLAILTGHPLEATDILRDLAEGNHPDLWWDFMNSYAGRATWLGSPEDKDALAESLRWRELLDKLSSMRPLLQEPQRCDAFAVWAGSVARYSFESGRVLLARPKQGLACFRAYSNSRQRRSRMPTRTASHRSRCHSQRSPAALDKPCSHSCCPRDLQPRQNHTIEHLQLEPKRARPAYIVVPLVPRMRRRPSGR